MSNSVLFVGGIDCNDRVHTFLVSVQLGVVDRQADEVGGPTIDIARAGPVDESARVASAFRVRIEGDDHQDLVSRINAIAEELRGDGLVVVYGEPEMVGTVELRCGVNPALSPERDVRYAAQDTAFVDITVSRDPWLYGPTETLYTAAASNLPAVVDLSAMVGLAAAPLEETVTAPSADLRCLWQGVYPDDSAVITDFVHEMHDKTWTGGAATTEAAGWPDGSGNTVWSDGSDALVTTSVDTADLLPGEYLILARCKTAVVHGDVFCGASAVEAEMLSAHVESTTLEWYPIGVVSLPTRAVRGASTAPLYVGIKSIASGTMYINCVALVPTSWGMVAWRDAASHCHTLVYEDEMVYADDAGGLAKAGGGRQLKALGGVIVAVGGRSSSVAPTLHTHWTLTYDPRWEQLQGW